MQNPVVSMGVGTMMDFLWQNLIGFKFGALWYVNRSIASLLIWQWPLFGGVLIISQTKQNETSTMDGRSFWQLFTLVLYKAPVHYTEKKNGVGFTW